MSGYAGRLQRSIDAEIKVLAELSAVGWTTYKFGQGLLPDEFRDAMKAYLDHEGRPSLLRWFPDLIAFKRESQRMKLLLLDVKHDTGQQRYAIEIKALEAAEAFRDRFFTPCWFIWPGLLVLTPGMIRESGWVGPSGGGSGTPYMLIEKSVGRPLCDVEAQRWPLPVASFVVMKCRK